MNDFLTTILARLFDSFKLKNPKIAALVVVVLLTIIKFANEGTMLGLFVLPEWASTAVQWVSTLLVSVVGSRTTNFLHSENNRVASKKQTT